jgi:hypothetical protein
VGFAGREGNRSKGHKDSEKVRQKDLPQSVAIATLDHPSIPKGVAKKNSDSIRHRYKGQDHNDPDAGTHPR